jgi:UDP-N-acetylmuramoyl-tripeptide--D-alanyl-D-alanine ligase
MIVLQFLGIVFVCLGTVAGLVRCFHMLQQNSYKPERYIAFGKTTKKARPLCGAVTAVLLGLLALWHPVAFLIGSVLFSGIRVVKNRKEQKKAIKPLVLTARVKRQFATAVVLLIANGVLWWLLSDYRLVFTILPLAFFGLTPLFALLVLYINAPLEKAVSNHFINDAKRILKQSPNMKIIGVTGSYGKTSTKFIITRLLQEKYTVLQKAPWMLPLVWIYRPFYKLIRKEERSSIARHRKNWKDITAKNLQDRRQALQYVGLDYHF